ncbi:Alpha-ketoglutarate-dependent dioxygenase alkB [Verticillium dahliae VDG2]|nr:Alpha-ketoglutarate-dependent dioxygenase alkB [Verticillium dahliae VDG2]
MDGGGVRGILHPLYLKRIEEELDLPIPVQEHFGFAYGISVGGMVILGLYDKGWSATTCAVMLEVLAEQAFETPGPAFIQLFLTLWWVQMFVGLALGHLYSSRGIELALQEAFGEKHLSSPSYATSVGTKIGVLAASTDQPSTCLFTNYNGAGGARTGYNVPEQCHQVKTWEIARGTSAAPL